MKICIWTGASWEPWGPPTLESGGIGGSETAAVHVGFELAKLGHEVELWGQHDGFEGQWDGKPLIKPLLDPRQVEVEHVSVKYVHFQKGIDDPKSLDCDVLVASRDKRTLRLPFKTRARVLWVHDVHVGDDWEHEVGQHDLIYALSEWHKGYMSGVYEDVPPHKFKVIRNGIDPARFALGRADGQTGRRADVGQTIRRTDGQICGQCGGTGKMKIQAGGFLVDDPLCSGSGRLPVSSSARLRALKKPQFVYSSSPDRGLDVLLDVWPEIRKLRDDAELHVYYGFENWRKLNAANKRGLIIVDHMESRVLGKEDQEIYYHGRVGQKEIAQAHLRSMVWAYPTNFSETYCISALEAQAAGAVPVTSRVAALAETVKCGTLLEPSNKTPRYKTELLAAVAQQLAAWERGEAPSAREWALSQTWEGVARGWVEDFTQILDAKRT